MDIEKLEKLEKKDKITQAIGSCLGLILIPALIGLGMNLSNKHDEKYPWKASLFFKESGDIIDSKDFKTLDECRSWANNKGENYADGFWDYVCGKGCSYSDQSISGGKRINKYSCTQVEK